MKFIVLFFTAVLAFASCASTATEQAEPVAEQPTAPAEQKPAASPAQQAKVITVQIPVMKKSLVKFADGTLDEYTVSEYDSSDKLLLKQSRFLASGTLQETTDYSYQNGLAVSKIIKDGEGLVKTQTEYEYNDRGLLRKETLFNAAGKTLSSSENNYDSDGNRTSRILKDSGGTTLAEISYTYKNGLLVTSVSKDGTGKKTGSTEYAYDADGNLVTQRMLNANGSVIRILASQWKDGYEIKNEQTTAGGQVQRRTTNEYGSVGELSKSTIENIQGKSTQIAEYEYTFREEERTIYE